MKYIGYIKSTGSYLALESYLAFRTANGASPYFYQYLPSKNVWCNSEDEVWDLYNSTVLSFTNELIVFNEDEIDLLESMESL